VAPWERGEDRDAVGVGHPVLSDLVDAREVSQHPACRAREVSPTAGGVVVHARAEQQ
jgi:hypothetical protein